MKTFSLRVIASDRVFYEGKCKHVVLPQEDGERAVQVHHEDMMFAVVPGEMRFTTEADEQIVAEVSRGFAQIINNRMTVLVLYAERPEEIDRKRAELEKEQAEEVMRQKKSQQEYHSSQMEMARAMAELRVGKRNKMTD